MASREGMQRVGKGKKLGLQVLSVSSSSPVAIFHSSMLGL